MLSMNSFSAFSERPMMRRWSFLIRSISISLALTRRAMSWFQSLTQFLPAFLASYKATSARRITSRATSAVSSRLSATPQLIDNPIF